MNGKNLSVNLKNLGVLGLVVVGIVLMLSVSVNAGCVTTDKSEDYKCGATITKNCNMNEDLTMTGKGPCFIIGNDGITIDGNGHSIIGNSSFGNMPIDLSRGMNQNTISQQLQNLSYGISTINFSKINFSKLDPNNPDISYLWSIKDEVKEKNNVVIKNLTIHNFDIGIFCRGNNNQIINNTISNNSLVGIALINSNNLIANNTINNTLLGIGLVSYTSYSFSFILFSYTFSLESDNNNVTNNTLENTLLGIGLLSLEKNTAKNNNIKDNSIRRNGIGIGLLSSTNNTVSNNIINQTLIGIAANDSDSNLITNNTANNGLVGIALNSSMHNYIACNNLTNNHIYSLFDFGDKGCNNVENNTGGDGKPIKYINDSIGINVMNTDEYAELIFCRVNNSLIDNITITNPQTKSDGIVFVYSNNNTIKNSNLNNDFIGIALSSSNDNNISNNSVNNNAAGIGLLSSVNDIIANNKANRNMIGIALLFSTNNTITNNTANNGLIGMGLASSVNNYIASNNLTNNRIYSLFDLGDKGCNNVENNTGGDGKPIHYINDSIGVDVSNTDEYSELIFCRVNNSLINNVTITNPQTESDGILLAYSNNNTINNSKLNNDFIGIDLISSNNNYIIYNTAKNNTLSGISLTYSNNTNINNNTLDGGVFKNGLMNYIDSSLIDIFIHIQGSSIYKSVNNIVNSNMINDSRLSGTYIDPAIINTFLNNLANQRTFTGIALTSSYNNNISNNTANNNHDGILLYSSSNNTIVNDTANSNNNYGINLEYASNITITNNTANSNNVGIFSRNSTSIINGNIVCENENLDFNSTDWLSSYGDNNTCNKPDKWNDTTAQNGGCKNKCPEPKQLTSCKMPKDVLDAVKILEYLSGQENSTEYCDYNNDGKRGNLNDVLDLIGDIVVRG